SDAEGLHDAPTLLINLATRLVEGEDLRSALTTLLGEVLVTRVFAPTGTGYAPEVLLLPDPAGGVLEGRRLAPPVTPAEYARAVALVDLAASVGRLRAGSGTPSPAP